MRSLTGIRCLRLLAQSISDSQQCRAYDGSISHAGAALAACQPYIGGFLPQQLTLLRYRIAIILFNTIIFAFKQYCEHPCSLMRGAT